jgi:hypothetical protein
MWEKGYIKDLYLTSVLTSDSYIGFVHMCMCVLQCVMCSKAFLIEYSQVFLLLFLFNPFLG